MTLPATNTTLAPRIEKRPKICVLHLGNSIQYYNDCPRVLHRMLEESGLFESVSHEECLRGGANFVTLHKYGTHWLRRAVGGDYGVGTIEELFSKIPPTNNGVDYVFCVFNDHTQAPARNSSREASLKALEEIYVPLLKDSKAVPIFIETAAYKKDHAYGTKDIGDFEQFTKLLQEGYAAYKSKLSSRLPNTPCYVAKMGTAHQVIRQEDSGFWEALYSSDWKHPSCNGTILEAFLLYLTILKHMGIDGVEAPTYNPEWLDPWFRMSPPTREEALRLWDVATMVLEEN